MKNIPTRNIPDGFHPASVGYGMLAIKAAEMRDQGKQHRNVSEWLEKHKNRN